MSILTTLSNDGVPIAGSILIQISIMLAVVLLCLRGLRQSHVVAHAFCVGAIVFCVLAPPVALAVRSWSVAWYEVNLPIPNLPTTGVPSEVSAVGDANRKVDFDPNIYDSAASHLVSDSPSDSFPVDAAVANSQKQAVVNSNTQSIEEGQTESADVRVTVSKDRSARELRNVSVVPLIHNSSESTSPSVARSEAERADRLGASSFSSLFATAIPIALGLWGIGVLALLGRSLHRYRRFRRMTRWVHSVADSEVHALLVEVADICQLKRLPLLVTSQTIPLPFVYGMLRPRIAVPVGMLAQENRPLLRDVLLHECWHVRRGDLWLSGLQRVTKTVYWMHPWVHSLSARMTRLREEICDSHALNHSSPTHYARTLLKLAEGTPTTSLAMPIGVFGDEWSLEERVADLLSATRQREAKLNRLAAWAIACVFAFGFSGLAGIVLTSAVAVEPARPSSQEPTLQPRELLDQVLLRTKLWTGEHAEGVQSLNYQYKLGNRSQAVELLRGASTNRAAWQATTFTSGVHHLIAKPEQFELQAMPLSDDPNIIRLICRPKTPIRVSAGNGISGRWVGYYSHSTDRVELDIDLRRLVPVRERSGSTEIVFSQWLEMQPEQWVPGRVQIAHEGSTWDMHFDVIDKLVWLMSKTTGISKGNSKLIASTMDAQVNEPAVLDRLAAADTKNQTLIAELRRMVMANDAWLNSDLQEIESLDYTFHTHREDILERCYLDQQGLTVFEVVGDGQDQLGGIGERRIALPDGSWAVANSNDRLLWLRKPNPKSTPGFAAQLTGYGRRGCQIDLPIFRIAEHLDSIKWTAAETQRDNLECTVYEARSIPGGIVLGCGTMLASSSWSYVHHIRPTMIQMYVDKNRQVPIHETIISRDRVFEIDYLDWYELAPAQWVPQRINISSKDYFVCEYQFQLVGPGKHWMLKELTSWFEPTNKSRATIQDVRINEDSELGASAVQQIKATQDIYGQKKGGSVAETKEAFALKLGQWLDIGTCRVMLTLADLASFEIQVIADQSDTDAVPILLLDSQGNSIEFVSVALNRSGDQWTGRSPLKSTWDQLQDTRCVLASDTSRDPGGQVGIPVRLSLIPTTLDQPVALSVPDHQSGKTRAAEFTLQQAETGTYTAQVAIVSTNGPQQFPATVSVALFDSTRRLFASGQATESLRVESSPASKQFEIPISLPSQANARTENRPAFAAIAVHNGVATMAPMGSKWGSFYGIREVNVPIEKLFVADDSRCQEIAVQKLARRLADGVLEKEFFDRPYKRERLIERKQTRHDVIGPYGLSLESVLDSPVDKSTLVSAIRLLGHSGHRASLPKLARWFASDDSQIADRAAVSMVMLGDAGALQRVDEILDRPLPDEEADSSDVRRYNQVQKDALIALYCLGSPAGTERLGKTLVGDLQDMASKNEAVPPRVGRIIQLSKLLSYCDEHAVVWLQQATEFLDRHPDLMTNMDQSGFAAGLLKHEKLCRESVRRRILRHERDILYLAKGGRNANLLPIYREMMNQPNTPSRAFGYGVSYLWNLGTPEAMQLLRSFVDRREPQDVSTRMLACEALTALEDDAGLQEALLSLTEVYRAWIPTEESDLQSKGFEDVLESIDEVLERASEQSLREWIAENLAHDELEWQLAIVHCLAHTKSFTDEEVQHLRRWSRSSHARLAQQAEDLLRLGGHLLTK